MRIRALAGTTLVGLLFVLVLTATQAGSMPLESMFALTNAPLWSDFQPSNWVTGTEVTCTVQVYNQDGLISIATYRYSTNGGVTWSGELNERLTVVLDEAGTTAALTVTALPLPESATPNQNQIQFSIRDNLGVQRWSSSYPVRIDNTVPGSSVTSAGCYSIGWPGTITGIANDSGSGVSLVQITLRRAPDGWYYNGSSWQPTVAWLSTTGTTSWQYSFALQDGSYAVQSRAIDGVGHQQVTLGQGTFSYDGTAPQSTVETTGCFTQDTWTDVIVGSASDAFSGVDYVEITLQRASDGRYFDGSSWGVDPTWLSVSGTTAWSLPFTPPVESTYSVRSRAADNCGNVQSTLGENSFAYDNTPPQSGIDASGCYRAGDWPGEISGSASDAASSVESVQVTLRRGSDNLYYNGSSWGAAVTWLPVSGNAAWSLPFTPVVETTYTVRSRATDSCGHVQSPLGQALFTYDATVPQSAIATSGCFNDANWTGAIGGTSSDALSGVASVHITLRRESDGMYYSGSAWGVDPAWLSVSGTTAWSLPITPQEESAYTVSSRATDNCGNVQGVLGQASFTYDKTAPQSSVTTSGHFNAATWPGAISGSASDAVSGVESVQIVLRRASDGLYYNGSSWASTASWLGVSGTTAWTLPFSPLVETTYLVNSRATDGCGNVQSEHGMGTFVFANTAPGAPFSLSVVPTTWNQSNSFALSWRNPTHPSGIVRAHYKWDAPPTSNGDQSPGSPVSRQGIDSISGLAVPTEGTHRLYLWLEDAAGNVDYRNYGATASGAFKWDMTPPTTTIQSLTGAQGCSGWYTSTVEVSFVASDVTSGLSATFWRQDGGSWQQASGASFTIEGEGPHTVEYYSVDVAGNRETTRVLSPQVRIDALPPMTNQPSYTGTVGRDGWYVSPVRVVLGALDATSGVSTTYHQVNGGAFQEGRTFDVTVDGVHTIRYYSVDVACNQEAVRTAAPLKIDQTPPSTSARTEGVGEDRWFTASPVTVTLLAGDAADGVQTSGVDNIRYRLDGGSWQQHDGEAVTFTVSMPPGEREWRQTIEYYATDAAGNEELPSSLEIVIDTQAPGAINVYPIVTPAGWTRSNCFTLTWEASANPPDFSGIGGAYYSFTEPTSPTDGALVLEDDITLIPCIQVPAELGDGAHNVYVWLRDKAGNSDHRTRRVLTVRLDRTPPDISPVVAGNQCATSDWYNSCITVTFVATDLHSGMASGVISYRVNGGSWLGGDSHVLCDEGVYTVECRAKDSAGNTSDIVALPLLRVDPSAPGAPMDVQVVPADWSKVSTFTINWLNPGDLSGLAGVFYKQGSLPGSPTDGVYLDGVRSALPVVASAEGQVPVYVWLKDKACNSDHRNRATAIIRYDRTPPTTTFSVSGTVGADGWYTSAVEIVLTTEDLGSGWGSSHYRIGTETWQSGAEFTIGVSGVITFSYYSVDAAGNVEGVRTGSVRIDRDPPISFAAANSHSSASVFTVYWDGNDALSGIATFDVQYRAGLMGAWQDWVLGVDPSQTSKLFTGAIPGKTYYFRSRSMDKAGNVESYPRVADAYVSVDVLQNGDFERTLGNEWRLTWISGEAGQTSACYPLQVTTQSHTGGSTRAMVLGCPDQAGTEPGEGPPYGTSMICQTIDVPGAQDMPAPMWAFRYRILTYDVLWSQRYDRFYDSLHAGLGPVGTLQPTYVFTDGNRTQSYGTLMDLGWRDSVVDLRPYAGQTIDVCLANVTRVDTLFNTWTYVDDVRLVNLEHAIYVPIVQQQAVVSGLSASVHKTAALSARGER